MQALANALDWTGSSNRPGLVATATGQLPQKAPGHRSVLAPAASAEPVTANMHNLVRS